MYKYYEHRVQTLPIIKEFGTVESKIVRNGNK